LGLAPAVRHRVVVSFHGCAAGREAMFGARHTIVRAAGPAAGRILLDQ
jgi:predicted naringenin-chalcone synthase